MPDLLSHISRQLHGIATMTDIARKAKLLPIITAVQDWQSQRMLATHEAMLHQPRYAPALHFFVQQVYGPQDFSQRDQDIARLVPKLGKYLPTSILVSLGDALQLNALSFELDCAMANKLRTQDIDRQHYAAAYRSCNNQPQRQQQIKLLQALGNNLAAAVAIKGISTLLMLSRGPAKKAGLQVLHQFLQQGYKTFKRLGKVDDFILPIVHREQQLMNDLFDPAEANPLPDIPVITLAMEA
ncbi:MAG: hypothetical protein ACJA13_003610 [Paraglaciecola sp.]|jgi:hypothetical protein